MRKLNRYLAGRVLGAIAIVWLVLVSLESLFALLAQFDELQANYQVLAALVYIVCLLPKKLYELLPYAALIGCLMGLGSVAANSELVAMRAAGVPVWRIVWSVLKVASVLMGLSLLLGEYIAPVVEQVAETRKAIARSSAGFYAGAGFWHREGNRFMYFNAVEPNGVLYGVSIYHFDDHRRLQASTYAERALCQGNHWLLEHVQHSRFDGERFVTEAYLVQPWETRLTTTLLKVVVVKPAGLSITGLKTYINYLQQQELDTGEYRLAFWTKVLQPLSILAFIWVGIAFVFGLLRSVNLGLRIFAGVLIGIIFMVVQSILGPASLVLGLPPALAVLLPVLICTAIGLLLLRRMA